MTSSCSSVVKLVNSISALIASGLSCSQHAHHQKGGVLSNDHIGVTSESPSETETRVE